MAVLVPLPGSKAKVDRRRFFRRIGPTLLVLLALLAGGQVALGQVVSREYQLKAVLLYNLTQFVEWPKSAFESDDAPLVIGILGEDPFGSVLDEAVRDEHSNNRRIVVKRFSTVEEAKGCQVLFISSSRKKDFASVLAQLQGRPILTVADTDGFLHSGGMIQLAENTEKKIRIRINLGTARAGDLNLSAKLLRVAEVVSAGEN